MFNHLYHKLVKLVKKTYFVRFSNPLYHLSTGFLDKIILQLYFKGKNMVDIVEKARTIFQYREKVLFFMFFFKMERKIKKLKLTKST
jgi:hypothetical protein